MIRYYELPLRQTIMDASQAVQLDFVEQAKLLLQGFASVQIEVPGRALALRALAERDLEAAVTLLEVVFPTLRRSPVEVVLLEGGALEPFVRISLRSTAALAVAMGDELKRRLGTIDEVACEAEQRIFVAVAPLARLLGFDAWLSRVTHGAAIAQYAFESYRPCPKP